MTSDETKAAVNVLVRRLSQRLETGSIVPTAAQRTEEQALRAIEDAIVDLVVAHVRLQQELL